jgi:putative inorganic carbon (hco3(-)) transporter
MTNSRPDKIIRLGFYLLFGLVPFLFWPANYELFEYNKMVGVYLLTVIITGAWIWKSINEKEIKIKKTPFDIPILLFFGSQLLSALFSVDTHLSWFGYYSRFNGGILSLISYVLLYYAFVSNFVSESDHDSENSNAQYTNYKHHQNQPSNHPTIQHANNLSIQQSTFISRLLTISLISACVIGLYGILEHFGIDAHVWVQDVRNRVFSSLGQPNWLAAYLTALIPLTWYYVLKSQISNNKLQTNTNNHIQNSKRFGIEIFGIICNLEFVIWNLVSIIFFVTLIFTGSRSGLLAFGIEFIVFWGFVIINSRFIENKEKNVFLSSTNNKQITKTFYTTSIIYLLIIFIIGTRINFVDQFLYSKEILHRFIHTKESIVDTQSAQAGTSLLVTGGTESGEIRKYVWQAAFDAWKESYKTMAIGTGTETFTIAFFKHKPVGHNITSEWDFLYNKAHNEYLNYLTTTGILGLGSYLLFIGTIIYCTIQRQIPKITNCHPDPDDIGRRILSSRDSSASSLRMTQYTNVRIVNIALLSGFISILVTNFFGFSTVMVQLFLFLFPAIIVVLNHSTIQPSNNLTIQPSNHRTIQQSNHPTIQPSNNLTIQLSNYLTIPLPFSIKLLRILSSIFYLLLFIFIVLYWYADTLFASGYRSVQQGNPLDASKLFQKAVMINGSEPFYHSELSGALGDVALLIASEDATTAGQLATRAIEENDVAIKQSPQMLSYWKTRIRLFYTLTQMSEAYYPYAIEAIDRALSLSPNDPKLYYNKSLLMSLTGSTKETIDMLDRSIQLKPNYRDAFYAKYLFEKDSGATPSAIQTLKTYLNTVNSNDEEFASLAGEIQTNTNTPQ